MTSKVGSVMADDVVEHDDVRVAERRGGARFLKKSAAGSGVTDALAEQGDRYVAVEASIARPIHLAHASGTESGHDFMRTDACACGRGKTRRL